MKSLLRGKAVNKRQLSQCAGSLSRTLDSWIEGIGIGPSLAE